MTGTDQPTTPDLSRFDRDPEALAWARAKAEHAVKLLADLERQADERGDTDKARGIAIARFSVTGQLLGNEGCVVGGFDGRLAELQLSQGEVAW